MPTPICTYWALTPPPDSEFKTVAIMHLVEGSSLGEAIRKFSQAAFIPDSVREVQLSDLPQHRLFRGAWKDTGASIEHDMDRLAKIGALEVRAACLFQIALLDADEKKPMAPKAEIADKRKALNDLVKAVDAGIAKTAADLYALAPPVLKKNGNGHP